MILLPANINRRGRLVSARTPRPLTQSFENTQTFRVVQHAQSLSEMGELMRKGEAYVSVQIPPDFTRELHGGRSAQIQVLIDFNDLFLKAPRSFLFQSPLAGRQSRIFNCTEQFPLYSLICGVKARSKPA